MLYNITLTDNMPLKKII